MKWICWSNFNINDLQFVRKSIYAIHANVRFIFNLIRFENKAQFFSNLPSPILEELNYSRWKSICIVGIFFSELNLYLLFSSNLSWSQPSTEDQDAISLDGNDDIRQDIESIPDPDIDQDDSHSQGQEASPEPEMDQDDSVSQNTECTQGSEMDQNDSSSHQGTESTPEPETDTISQDTESTQESEMEQNDSNSHLDNEPASEPDQENETFTSAF